MFPSFFPPPNFLVTLEFLPGLWFRPASFCGAVNLSAPPSSILLRFSPRHSHLVHVPSCFPPGQFLSPSKNNTFGFHYSSFPFLDLFALFYPVRHVPPLTGTSLLTPGSVSFNHKLEDFHGTQFLFLCPFGWSTLTSLSPLFLFFKRAFFLSPRFNSFPPLRTPPLPVPVLSFPRRLLYPPTNTSDFFFFRLTPLLFACFPTLVLPHGFWEIFFGFAAWLMTICFLLLSLLTWMSTADVYFLLVGFGVCACRFDSLGLNSFKAGSFRWFWHSYFLRPLSLRALLLFSFFDFFLVSMTAVFLFFFPFFFFFFFFFLFLVLVDT